MEKQQIRQMVRYKREQLTKQAGAIASQKVTEHLLKSDMFLQSLHIACYFPKENELDTMPLIKKIWENQKYCYLPVVHPVQFGQMCFIAYSSQTKLVTNRFGIIEPIFQESEVRKAEDLDLVIMPLFAFDGLGHRLGSGGGYYDRQFNFLKKRVKIQKPLLCGVAYNFQQVPEIESQAWDISLNAVVTETGIIYFHEKCNG